MGDIEDVPLGPAAGSQEGAPASTPRACLVCPWHFYKAGGRSPAATHATVNAGSKCVFQSCALAGSLAKIPAAPPLQIDLLTGDKYFQSVTWADGKMTPGPWKRQGSAGCWVGMGLEGGGAAGWWAAGRRRSCSLDPL